MTKKKPGHEVHGPALTAYGTGSGSVFSGAVAATASIAAGSVSSGDDAISERTAAKKASTIDIGGAGGAGGVGELSE